MPISPSGWFFCPPLISIQRRENLPAQHSSQQVQVVQKTKENNMVMYVGRGLLPKTKEVIL